MAALGFPIVGDAKYGGVEAFLTGGISRKMHLHARRLKIDAPDGGAIDISADLPTHFAESLAMLGFNPMAGDSLPLDQNPALSAEVKQRRVAAARRDHRHPRSDRCRIRTAPAEKGLGPAGPARLPSVKRFWKKVEVRRDNGGWGVDLDGKPVRTPARASLAVPTRALADAIAEEWRGTGDKVDPRTMPLTGLANAAIDHVAHDRAGFAGGLARYAEADLACYRSEWPPQLVDRQAQSWDPLLAWGRGRFDVDFSTTSGLMHIPQSAATVDRLAHEVVALDPFQLAGLSPLVTVGGSLLAALAVFEKAMTADAAWEAVSVDDRWQLEKWGSDADAELALETRRRDFFAGARFLELLDQ
jgi:chaperone required for assembly of F1-ATPase